MARPMVIDGADGTRLPFLRGILTRSLQLSGVPFDEAYEISDRVRRQIDQQGEITAADLRARVLVHLKPYGEEVMDRYRRPGRAAAPITVVAPDGRETPFSRGSHRLLLQCCGLSTDEAADMARRIHDGLLISRVTRLTEIELRQRTHDRIARELGADASGNYMIWEQYRESGRPLILLFGGAPGTGKSSLATRIAHMLDISRTQPTDLLREVMRVMIPERLLPVLHRSSFLAAKALPVGPVQADPDTAVIEGYLTQSELVWVACEAAIRRAVEERLSLVIEGVHVHPGLVRHVPDHPDGIVVPVMLGVLGKDELKRRIRGRGKDAPGRRSKRFLQHFEALWKLQSYLLGEADRAGVPIVANDDREETVREVTAVITRALARVFTGAGL